MAEQKKKKKPMFKKKKKNLAKAASKPVRDGMPSQWYYLAAEKITVAEIRDAIADEKYDIEIWKDAGVLTAVVGEKQNLDMEEREPSFGNEADDAFLKEQGAKVLYDITITPGSYAASEKIFRKIVEGCGGMICADTEDFMPRIER